MLYPSLYIETRTTIIMLDPFPCMYGLHKSYMSSFMKQSTALTAQGIVHSQSNVLYDSFYEASAACSLEIAYMWSNKTMSKLEYKRHVFRAQRPAQTSSPLENHQPWLPF